MQDVVFVFVYLMLLGVVGWVIVWEYKRMRRARALAGFESETGVPRATLNGPIQSAYKGRC